MVSMAVKLEERLAPSLELPIAKKPRVKSELGDSLKETKDTKSPKQTTIKAPGQVIVRTAQACDRCRAKKSRCDGKVPDCSSCLAVGIKCIVSDKLTRRAFPKGYTETLEEYVRQLEAENSKLQGLVQLRDQQLAQNGVLASEQGEITDVLAAKDSSSSFGNGASAGGDSSDPLYEKRISSGSGSAKENRHKELDAEGHQHTKTCACCIDAMEGRSVHERPVSLAGANSALSMVNDDDSAPRRNSHESHVGQRPAPGAFAAASAIEQMHKGYTVNETSKQQLLTNLVAAAIPRSTEETLFVPTVLAKVCQVHGYNSAAAKMTAKAIALLKEYDSRSHSHSQTLPGSEKDILDIIMDVESAKLDQAQSYQFLIGLQLPSQAELDYLLGVYFQNWGCVLPILDQGVFVQNYNRFCQARDSGMLSQNLVHSFELWEKLGALLVLTTSMALLSLKSHYLNSNNAAELELYHDRLSKYNRLICQFIRPNCILTKHCSIESLHILALSLHYCLAVGDVATSYELRGRMITMAQQLRLHRCPAAVLGLSKDPNDVNLYKFMQAERRILFWCVYCLDSYSSLILGLPRLLKDNEVECAMPFSDANAVGSNDSESVLVVNNTRLTIFGKVTQIALCFMQYCKVLGGIVDLVFSRSRDSNERERAANQDRILDCWRRDLPLDLKFELDVNGFSLKNSNNQNSTDWALYSPHQILSIYLYYHAKILIYLPILSKYGNHHNVGLSAKEQLELDHSNRSTVVTSMSMIQQSSIQILELLKNASVTFLYLLPIPLNIPREQARFALLVAKGSIDYIKGGVLHQSLKEILLETFKLFRADTEKGILGALSTNSTNLLELSIASVLGFKASELKVKSSKLAPKRRLSSNPKILEKSLASSASNTASVPDPLQLLSSMPIVAQAHDTHPIFENRSIDPVVSSQQEGGRSEITRQSTEIETVMDNYGMHQLEHTASTSSADTNDGRKFDFESAYSDLFTFDPFKNEFNNELMVNEFVADGSLGLFPFLGEDRSRLDDDRFSDCMGEEGAFSY